MRFIIFILIFFLFYSTSNADLLRPNPSIEPKEVILIQLSALQNNNNPFINAGIAQAWEIAHPLNRQYTGPIEKFTNMIYSKSYVILLDHLDHKIQFFNNIGFKYEYYVEMTDKKGNQYGFIWTVEKVEEQYEFTNCWMTISVSTPISLAKSI